MSYYLLWPRRNRFAVNPVGVANDWILPSNARILLALFGIAANPSQVSQAVVAPTPVSDSSVAETLPALVANPVVVSADTYAKKASAVTLTIASPAVFTYTAHGFAANQQVFLTTTGALPTGLTASPVNQVFAYFVRNPTANTFELSLASGGSSLTTTGTQSGVHSLWYKL